MPSVGSLKSEISKLGLIEKEELLTYLEEVLVLGSYATQIVEEVVTLQDASEMLGCSDSTLRKQVLSGKFKDANIVKQRELFFSIKV